MTGISHATCHCSFTARWSAVKYFLEHGILFSGPKVCAFLQVEANGAETAGVNVALMGQRLAVGCWVPPHPCVTYVCSEPCCLRPPALSESVKLVERSHSNTPGILAIATVQYANRVVQRCTRKQRPASCNYTQICCKPASSAWVHSSFCPRFTALLVTASRFCFTFTLPTSTGEACSQHVSVKQIS